MSIVTDALRKLTGFEKKKKEFDPYSDLSEEEADRRRRQDKRAAILTEGVLTQTNQPTAKSSLLGDR